MKTRPYSKLIAYIITLSLVFSLVPASAIALGAAENIQIEKAPAAQAQTESLTQENMVLRYVDEAQFTAANHIARLPELEALNTYVFSNADGTKTVYYLNENVKFVDTDGKIKEKDLDLVSKTNGYTVKENELDLLIPTKLSSGVDISYGGYELKLIPQNISAAAEAAKSENGVLYANAFGAGTALLYTPQLSGVKEDIILAKYIPNASFSFVLETDGLGLYQNREGYYLAKSETAEPLFYLGDIVVYDAIGKPDSGNMTVETVTNQQKYLLTLSANEEFLTDESTVYPVVIDPSITISDTATGTNSIQDAPLYSGATNTNFGTYIYNRVGRPASNTSYGRGRTVIRLKGLTDSATYQSLTANQITSVKMHVRESTGTTAQYINIYPLTNTTWTESGVKWNNIGSHDTSYDEWGTTMNPSVWAQFDLTELVQLWKDGTLNAQAGFIMISNSEYEDKAFFSSEHSSTTYRPYVTLTYGGGGGENPGGGNGGDTGNGGTSFETAEELTLNTTVTVTLTTAGQEKYFSFTPSTTGFYTFESLNLVSGNPRGWLYYDHDELDEQLAYNDNASSSTSNFNITYHLRSGKTYYLRLGSNSSTATFDIKVSSAVSVEYAAMTTIIAPSENSVTIDQSYKVKYYKFIPTFTGDYIFASSANANDPVMWLYNSSLTQLAHGDDIYGENATPNFEVRATLTAGSTYYIVAANSANGKGGFSLDVYRVFSSVNYFDEEFDNETILKNNILAANIFANKVYRDQLKIVIEIEETEDGENAEYHRTLLDDCTSDPNNVCSPVYCGGPCATNHHKNTERISDDLFSDPREDNHIYVYWTHRTYGGAFCKTVNGLHEQHVALGCVWYNRPVVHFMCATGNNAGTRLACMSIVLAHEIAHTLGMHDNYNDPEHAPKGMNCIMELFDETTAYEFYDKISYWGLDPLCDSCTTILKGLAPNASILGNQ